LSLPQIGEAGQAALMRASVLCVGTAPRAWVAALHLAGAGIGRIGMADDETGPVEAGCGWPLPFGQEGLAAEQALDAAVRGINPDVRVDWFGVSAAELPGMPFVANFDIILDGCEDYDSRYAMNEAARNAGKPLIHGSVEGFEGQLATLMPWDNHACYQCLYPEPPPDQLRSGGADNGAAGVTAGLIGTLQAAEVIKLVTGTGQPLIGQLLVYDLLAGAFKKLKIQRNPRCPRCNVQPLE